MPGLLMKKRPDDEEELDDAEAPAEEVQPKPARGMVPAEEGEDVADPPPAIEEGDPDDTHTALETFVKNGMKLIYNQQTIPQMLESLDGDGNPVEGLANTLAAVVTRLIDSATRGNAALPPDVILKGAGELLGHLAEFSEQSGGHAYTDPELATVAKVLLQATQSGGEAPPAGPAQPPPAQPTAPPPRRGLLG